MNILYITNVYPTKMRHMSPIVKNTVEHYKLYYNDNIILKVINKKNFFRTLLCLRNELKSNSIDILHIHFGGFYAFLIVLVCVFAKPKKIITFHGTDIHARLYKKGAFLKKLKIKINQLASFLSFMLVDKIDFVSNSLVGFIPSFYGSFFKYKYNISILGVDYNIFQPLGMYEAKKKLNLDEKINYILFVNNNNSLVKRENYANDIIKELGENFKMLKLENISYDNLYLYFNSSLFLLITSENEGSPNIVREALASNLPIVSVDVGDVLEYLKKTNNSIIIEKYDSSKAVKEIQAKLSDFCYRENTREKFKELIAFEFTSKKLNLLYKTLIKE